MKNSTAFASDRAVRATAVTSVRARRLALEPRRGRPALPEWAHVALRPRAAAWPENHEQYVIEVESGDGVVGRYGPCSAVTVQVIRDQVAPALVGRPAAAYRGLGVGSLRGRHRSGAHMCVALSAVRLAVLDLLSREREVPVCALLGGPLRASVPVYASALGLDIDHPVATDVAVWLVEHDFAGQKWMLPGSARGEEPRCDAQRLTRLREAVGPRAPIMVDALGRWKFDYAVRMLPILADIGVAWLEEPLDPQCMADLRRLRGISPVPIAGGEHAYDRATQLAQVGSGSIDVWQPDVGWHGGLVDAVTVVDVAAAHGLRVYPHGGSLAAAVALAGLTEPDVLPAVEYHLTQEPLRQQAFTVAVSPVDGALVVPETAGLAGEFQTAETPALELAGVDHVLA